MLNLVDLKKLESENKLRGIFEVEESAYHAGPGVSQTTLKKFKQSPAHVKAYLESEKESSKDMEIGTALHCSFLEPEAFSKLYVSAPDIKRNSNAGKEAYAAWESENQGKKILPADDMVLVKAMTTALQTHEDSAKMSSGKMERAAYWIDEATGLLCKCKLDCIVPAEGIVLDLKTTRDEATPQSFAKTIANYGYHIQASFYLDGIKAAIEQSVNKLPDWLDPWMEFTRFVFVVVEKSAPHGVALFELDEADLFIGRELYRSYLEQYAACKMDNNWPSYRPGIQTVRLPQWA